jgi:7-cyano-7-deazaguanine synthase in queuosine biosynthesis
MKAGGLDSCVSACIAKKKDNALSFDYGQKHKTEQRLVKPYIHTYPYPSMYSPASTIFIDYALSWSKAISGKPSKEMRDSLEPTQ